MFFRENQSVHVGRTKAFMQTRRVAQCTRAEGDYDRAEHGGGKHAGDAPRPRAAIAPSVEIADHTEHDHAAADRDPIGDPFAQQTNDAREEES